MKKLYYSICILLVSIPLISFGFIILRLGCKQILIDKMNVKNEVVCVWGNYVWGDRLTTERSMMVDDSSVKSERLLKLEELLEEQPEESTTATAKKQNIIDKYDVTCTSVKRKLDKYCQENFFFYSSLRELAYKWDLYVFGNMTYAREAKTLYTLNDGVVAETIGIAELSQYSEDILQKAMLAEQAQIPYLYVQYPYRVDREKGKVPWGVSTYENENADRIVKQLREQNVDVLDLRDELALLGWNSYEGFYKTDGHWTTESGFISAGVLAEYLNDNYACKFDLKYFDEQNYNVQSYSLNNWTIKENVELRIPKFETNMNMVDAYRSKEYKGTFEETWLDKETVETTKYSNVLTAYSGLRVGNSRLLECENTKNVNNQIRILVCSDSFSWHLVPYLSLDCKYINFVCEPTPEKMEYYIKELSPDMVIELARPKYYN